MVIVVPKFLEYGYFSTEMAEEKIKVYTPEEIADTPFPQEEETDLGTSQETSGGVYSPTTIKDKKFPTKRIAHELIASVLNTRSRKILAEFEFTEMGAIQIGKYQNGVSGDLRISPNGITARDLAGITTFAIDGETGDAVFKGTIQAGSLIAAEIDGGNIVANTITRVGLENGLGSGAFYKTLDSVLIQDTDTGSRDITDVDMSLHVPIDTVAVILDVGIKVGAGECYVELWKKGETGYGYILRECQVDGVYNYTTVIVGLDADRKFQYDVATEGLGPWNLAIGLLGYFLKIT